MNLVIMKNKISPVFIINLKKDIEKKEYMQELCQKYNLQIEFMEAVDGRALSEEAIAEVYSSKRTIDVFGRELSRGEIGCALSHKTIYEKILHDNIEIALVLEDDINFNEDIITLLNLKNTFPQNWELILLGHHTDYSREVDTVASIWNQMQLTANYTLARPSEKGYGTYGYLITKNGAIKLLGNLDIIEKPIDHYTGDSQYINLYIINPTPIKIHEQLSEDHNSMHERNLLNSSQNLETFKNKVRQLLTRLLLLKSFSIMKSFFKQFKILKKY